MFRFQRSQHNQSGIRLIKHIKTTSRPNFAVCRSGNTDDMMIAQKFNDIGRNRLHDFILFLSVFNLFSGRLKHQPCQRGASV